jgi:hypothetical protein
VCHPPVLRLPEVLPQQAVFPQPAVRQRAESCRQPEAHPERLGADRFAAMERQPAVRRVEASQLAGLSSRHRRAARREPASSAEQV